MNHDFDYLSDVHALLDPLIEGGILSSSQCEAKCNELEAFLRDVRADHLATDEAFWTHFQSLFDFATISPRITPMNAANLCPEPRVLLNAANQLRLEYNRNVSQQMRMARGQRVLQLEQSRRLLAQGLGLDDVSDLAILRNASEGNNAVNAGFHGWVGSGERENVVLWSENHPTNLEAWRLRAHWGRGNDPAFDPVVVRIDNAMTDEAIASAFTNNINERTRFVSFSDTANSTGFRIPEAAIAAIWQHVQRFTNCHLHIDGTMAWGARSINLSNPRCHSFVSSAHKWFLGPKETGILYMSKDKAIRLSPSIFAYDYKIVVPEPWQSTPANALRFELLGQRDDVNIITLALTQIMWNELQIRQPYARVIELASYLIEQLRQPAGRWTLVTPTAPERRGGVIRIQAPRGGRSQTLYNWLYERYGIAGSGDEQTFRLCPHIYNTKADIERAVVGMNQWFES